ncbi:hypothetical protein GCM10007940_05080 [Portibacter lacus]|uniref:Uncharacterized protein n=2 Tax=Portibacter lacus TaxID=1099794 RepID=A0AA37SJE3_9BACT|nr:hypothetical protein GCM10007940_05080 [Portibacter lacus]
MVIINETSRLFIKDKPFKYQRIIAMNSGNYDSEICTWACHNSTTNHCIPKHTRIIKEGFPFYDQINDFYWGIINFNSKKVKGKKVSNPRYYAAMNIVFLVVLWPLAMFFLLVNYLKLRAKFKTLSS